jgi:hypothetical protein
MNIDLDLHQKEMEYKHASEQEEREEAASLVAEGWNREAAKRTAKQLRFEREEAERRGEVFMDEDGHAISYWDASLNHPAPHTNSKLRQVKAISKDMFGD